MENIIKLILITVFYLLAITYFIILLIHENKMNKLHREYWTREMERINKMRKMECKKSAKKSKSEE